MFQINWAVRLPFCKQRPTLYRSCFHAVTAQQRPASVQTPAPYDLTFRFEESNYHAYIVSSRRCNCFRVALAHRAVFPFHHDESLVLTVSWKDRHISPLVWGANSALPCSLATSNLLQTSCSTATSRREDALPLQQLWQHQAEGKSERAHHSMISTQLHIIAPSQRHI